MKKLLLSLVAMVVMATAQTGVQPTTRADITGDGSVHQLAASGSALWVQFVADSANAGTARVGDSLTTSSRGIALSAGKGFFFPAVAPENYSAPATHRYDLSAIYYYAPVGDHLVVLWVN